MTGERGRPPDVVIEVSVVIACRDAADSIGEQLAALTRQRPGRTWEVLVCDNGSSDGTLEVVRRFRDRLPLRVLDASHLPGAGHARNVGVHAAHGRWVAFCDADDVVSDDWLARMCDALERHRFVAGRLDGRMLNRPSVLRTRTVEQQEGLQRTPGYLAPHAGSCNLGIERALFVEVGGFDETLRVLEDTDLCWRVQREGVELAFADDVLVHLRLRASTPGRWRQGLAYGRGFAELASRYPADAGGAADAPGPVRRIGRVWQLGWRVGYWTRRWTAARRAALVTPDEAVSSLP